MLGMSSVGNACPACPKALAHPSIPVEHGRACWMLCEYSHYQSGDSRVLYRYANTPVWGGNDDVKVQDLKVDFVPHC